MAALMPFLVAGLAIFGGFSYGPAIKRTWTLTGLTRTKTSTPVLSTADLVTFDDTTHCEDLHHHTPSGLLFTACEDNAEIRVSWFPSLTHLGDPAKGVAQKGSIHVIDPKDMTQRRLKFENYDQTFVTHGIDVISDPQKPEAVYIYAVNHVPHPEYLAAKLGGQSDQAVPQKSQSRIEIFHHILGSSTIRHLRSVLHPLIKTPNDIFIKDPYSFYVTNDHSYTEGLGRMAELFWPGASWTNTIHVRVDEMSVLLPTEGIKAEVALSGLRNNNGLGHRNPGEILVVNCYNGELLIGQLPSDPKNTSVSIVESILLDTYIDNPSWFEDPYRSEGQDASGFVLGGISKPIEVLKKSLEPSSDIGSIVWYVKPVAGSSGGYERRLLFEDDGNRISSAATAVMVAIDPAKEHGQRKAWLFITGFMSSNVVAVKVDL